MSFFVSNHKHEVGVDDDGNLTSSLVSVEVNKDGSISRKKDDMNVKRS